MKNKQLLGGLALGVLLLTITMAQEGEAQSNNFCPSDLSQKIDEMIDHSQAGVRWGMMIQSQDSEEIIYQRNSDEFFIPASNVKLFTSAIALRLFDPEFKITTPIYQQGTSPNLDRLQIIGQGDPSLTTDDLESLATQLQAEGVQEIETVVLETGYFSKPYFPSSWEWEDVYGFYGSPANSLILDENSVNLTLTPTTVGEEVNLAWESAIAASQWNLDANVITTSAENESNLDLERQLGTDQLYLTGELPEDRENAVWGFSIPNPDRYFRDALLVALSEHNIQVNNIEFSDSKGEKVGEEIMRFESPRLSELLEEINLNSNNLYAEALLRKLRALAGEEIIEDSLTALGINADNYHFVDGSGLSRRNLVTPSAIAQLLQTESNEVFRSSLPVAGVSGTLENRFQDTPLEGNLQAKTGTMTGISALSGYVELPNYQPLVFSMMVNHYQVSASQKREMMDEILLLLPRLEEC
ncbi:MAG: D-alanyl-D-alanine carboxypeptidase/D-alanyl-D-alanine-endopeptidase [Halothece sp.]